MSFSNFNIPSVDQRSAETIGYSGQGTKFSFRQLLGGVAGSLGNLFMPGAGSIIGGLIGGGSGSPIAGMLGNIGLSGDSMEYLMLQKRMQEETRAFEAISNVLKARHDAAMAAIRNIR